MISILSISVCFLVNAHAEDSTPWTDRVSVSGDLRIRHDWVSKTKVNDTAEVHKERYRARLNVAGKVNDSVSAKVRLASSDGGNPISNNSTFTDNSSKKSVYIDVAAIDWKLYEGANAVVGKQDMSLRPIKRSQLVYDDDYTSEGISISANKPVFVRLGAFSIQERSPQADGTSEPDSWLNAALAGYQGDLSESLNLLAGIGYHDFTALKKNAALNGGFLGNSNTGTRYEHDYKIGEAFLEAKQKFGTSSLSVYADYIQNFGADKKNTGVLVGTQFQTMDEHDKPVWIFSYTYQANGKDSTVSAINNSDLNNGIDGGFGHIVTVGRTVASNTLANLTVYRGQVDNSGNSFWIDRAQADLSVNF